MDGSACESASMTCVPITSFSAGCEVRNLSAHVSYRQPRSVRLGRRTSRKASQSQRGSLVLPLLSLTKRHRNSPYLALLEESSSLSQPRYDPSSEEQPHRSRVLVVDDNCFIRQILAEIFAREADFEVWRGLEWVGGSSRRAIGEAGSDCIGYWHASDEWSRCCPHVEAGFAECHSHYV